jgi:hypothetical protein
LVDGPSSVGTAVQAQILGLGLESMKFEMQVTVIDHIEPPERELTHMNSCEQ